MQTRPPGILSRIFRRTQVPLAARQPLCSGAATGNQCVHYWPTGRMSGQYSGDYGGEEIHFEGDPEFQRHRHCTLGSPARRLPDDPARLPSYCARYEPGPVRFDPLFEVPPPADPTFDMTAALAGGEANLLHYGTRQAQRRPGEEPLHAPKDWDASPGAPVLPPEPGDSADAPARRGFIHCEVADHKTACSRKAPLMKCAPLVAGDVAKTLAGVTCPGCLVAIAENAGIRTIVAKRAQDLLDFITEKTALEAVVGAVNLADAATLTATTQPTILNGLGNLHKKDPNG